jgi:predicted dehydrogenase
MCHLFGRAIEVTAAMDTLKQSIESEDTCAATVRFENGALVCCYGTMTAARSTNAFDVVGESGSVHLPWAIESLDSKWRDRAAAAVLAVHPIVEEAKPAGLSERLRLRLRPRPVAAPVSAHAPYVAAVLSAIEQGQPLPIGPDQARASLEICTAIYASALSGQPIQLPVDPTNRCYAGVTTTDYDGRRRHDVRMAAAGTAGVATGVWR